jgi:hypothetical protein
VEDAEREGGSRPSQQELALLGGLSLEEPWHQTWRRYRRPPRRSRWLKKTS